MEIDPAAWRSTLAANLDGTFFTIRAFYPLLRKTGRRAKIICFSGGGATGPRPNFAAYGVSKAGVVRLVETLAAEWQGQPLDINAVAPGAIFTRMTEQVLARGAAVAGKVEFEQRLPAIARRWRTTRKSSGVDRVSIVIEKRRHHRQAHQRGLGPVGKTSPNSRKTWTVTFIRCAALCPKIAERHGETNELRHHRLRIDWEKAAGWFARRFKTGCRLRHKSSARRGTREAGRDWACGCRLPAGRCRSAGGRGDCGRPSTQCWRKFPPRQFARANPCWWKNRRAFPFARLMS